VPKGTGGMIAESLKTNENPTVEYASYAVQKGDTLYTISKKFNSTPEKLSSINKIDIDSHLLIGKELIIPEDVYLRQGEKKTVVSKDFRPHLKTELLEKTDLNDEGDITASASKKSELARISKVNKKSPQITYKVKKGDTLWKISKRYEVKPEDIRKWNQLETMANIHPGDRLTIHLKH
jgi:membrane-bound lytic murein transglycosylase D